MVIARAGNTALGANTLAVFSRFQPYFKDQKIPFLRKLHGGENKWFESVDFIEYCFNEHAMTFLDDFLTIIILEKVIGMLTF